MCGLLQPLVQRDTALGQAKARPGLPHLFPEPGRPKVLASPFLISQGSPKGTGKRPSGKETAEVSRPLILENIVQSREGATPLAIAGCFGWVGGEGQRAERASLSKREAPCHKDKVALPVALPGPASVLLSLWRVGQRERGPKSSQSRGLMRLSRRGGPLVMKLLVTAQNMKGCGGNPMPAGRGDATPPAPTAEMWLAGGQGREGG